MREVAAYCKNRAKNRLTAKKIFTYNAQCGYDRFEPRHSGQDYAGITPCRNPPSGIQAALKHARPDADNDSRRAMKTGDSDAPHAGWPHRVE